MEQHFNLTDPEFEMQFARCTLDPALFTHEAHIRLAWIHIVSYGEHEAIENITAQLKSYVVHLGAAGKYNETLTVAAIKAVSHFIQKKHCPTFREFISTFPRLRDRFKEIMGRHYSFDIFTSPIAKEQYLEPDVQAFTSEQKPGILRITNKE